MQRGGEEGFSLRWQKIWNCQERRVENTGSDFPKLNCKLEVSTSDHRARLLEMVTFLFLSCRFKFETALRGLHNPLPILFILESKVPRLTPTTPWRRNHGQSIFLLPAVDTNPNPSTTHILPQQLNGLCSLFE